MRGTTSALSPVSDLTSLGALGLTPCGPVVGTMAWRCAAFPRTGLSAITSTLTWDSYAAELANAVRTALERMRERRTPDGIIGIGLRLEWHEPGGRRIEVVGVGTGVSGDPPWPAFSTHLGASDLALLHDAGYAPLRVAVGAGAMFVSGPGRLRSATPARAAMLSQTRQEIWRRALSALRADARRAGGQGCVDLQHLFRVHGVPNSTVGDERHEVLIWGTAVRGRGRRSEELYPATFTLSLG